MYACRVPWYIVLDGVSDRPPGKARFVGQILSRNMQLQTACCQTSCMDWWLVSDSASYQINVNLFVVSRGHSGGWVVDEPHCGRSSQVHSLRGVRSAIFPRRRRTEKQRCSSPHRQRRWSILWKSFLLLLFFDPCFSLQLNENLIVYISILLAGNLECRNVIRASLYSMLQQVK